MQPHSKQPREVLIELTKNNKIDLYRPQKLIEKITQSILVKIQKIMRDYPQLNISQFLRLFMHILKNQIPPDDDFYFMYGLFKVFKEICRSYKTPKITFSQLSSFITQKMPTTDQQVIVKEKLLPTGFEIPEEEKKNIQLPSISGKIISERVFLMPTPALFDKFQHINRCIAQALYSPKHEMYLSLDLPSNYVRFSEKNFNEIVKVQSQLEISKKQSVVTYMAWSQTQERLGAILGNYSISFWSKQDGYRFQVNVPFSLTEPRQPYVVLGYMESMNMWYAIDNKPAIYGLSSTNFQPEFQIKSFRMTKENKNQKILTLEMKYQKLLCVGFQRKVFLLSLKKRQIITEISNFRTSITSMVFSQTFQVLFVSCFQNYFKAFQLTDYCDLTQKGKLEGHKHQIILLGVVEKKPIVYSLQETWLMKLWDIRNLTCYQTFSVLKNVRYLQMFTVNEGVCLVGSKMYLYKWESQEKQNKNLQIQSQDSRKIASTSNEKIILITSINKNILLISNLTLKLFEYHKGSLTKVVRGIFEGRGQITFAYHMVSKKELYISNVKGYFKVLETESLTCVRSFKFLYKPQAMHYSQKQDLITMVVIREIQILEWRKQEQDYDLKRRIFNEKENIFMCKVYSLHDLIATVYEKDEDQLNKKQNTQNSGSNCIYFYSFERGKAIGYIEVQNVVEFEIHEKKNILIVLEIDKIKIYTFHKTGISLSFSLCHQIKLWSGENYQETLRQEFVQYMTMFRESVYSRGVLIFENSVIILSNFSCLNCKVSINFQTLCPGTVRNDSNNQNPYRIASQNHIQAFSQMPPSQIIDKTEYYPHIIPKYHQTKAIAKTIYILKLGNLIGIYNDKQDLHLFQHTDDTLLGVINSDLTLPKMWNMSFFDENQLQDVQFVLDYMENQEKKKKLPLNSAENDLFALTLNNVLSISPHKKKPSPLTIQKILQSLGKLSPQKSSLESLNHYSLRQRKLTLQKQRQQRLRLQNFIEHQEQEAQNKLYSFNTNDAQANINEILNFFAPNRNQIVKNKGLREADMPQIKLLEKKLENSLKKIERTSSLVESIEKNPSNVKFSDQKSQKSILKLKSVQKRGSNVSTNLLISNDLVLRKMNSLKLLQTSAGNLSNDSPYKHKNIGRISEKNFLIEILNEDVRKSKLSTRYNFSRQRNSSLPTLKKQN